MLQALGTPGNGAQTVIKVDHARAASCTAFLPDSVLHRPPEKFRIEYGVYFLCWEGFRKELRSHSAGHGQDGVKPVTVGPELFHIFKIALTLYSSLFYLQSSALLISCNFQNRS